MNTNSTSWAAHQSRTSAFWCGEKLSHTTYSRPVGNRAPELAAGTRGTPASACGRGTGRTAARRPDPARRTCAAPRRCGCRWPAAGPGARGGTSPARGGAAGSAGRTHRRRSPARRLGGSVVEVEDAGHLRGEVRVVAAFQVLVACQLIPASRRICADRLGADRDAVVLGQVLDQLGQAPRGERAGPAAAAGSWRPGRSARGRGGRTCGGGPRSILGPAPRTPAR